MSNIKEIVQNSLRLKQVSPEIIASVDTLIQRAVIDLQKDDLLPARNMEFTSLDKKQEKRGADGVVLYNFYYLPTDFRKLDNFKPRTNNPYLYTDKLSELYTPPSTVNTATTLKKFGIFNVHNDEDSKFEKILVAYPFPDDSETIDLKYYSNGRNQNWDWLDETYWETIISWVYRELGLRSSQEVEEDLGRAVSNHKESKGHNLENQTFRTLQGSYFGKRNRDYLGSRRINRTTTD